MTNYTTGEWNDWNGGKPPASPSAVVEYVTNDSSDVVRADCGSVDWLHTGNLGDVISFRVLTKL